MVVEYADYIYMPILNACNWILSIIVCNKQVSSFFDVKKQISKNWYAKIQVNLAFFLTDSPLHMESSVLLKSSPESKPADAN